MFDQNPYSRGLHADRETITTVAMLLGEQAPVLCSCCIGKGYGGGIFGGLTMCGQCHGTGYDILGAGTLAHFMKLRIENG